jgi:hypothetical protein
MRHDLHLHKGAFKVSYSFWTLKVTVSRRSKALACKLSNNTTEPPQPTYHVPLPSKQRAVISVSDFFSERGQPGRPIRKELAEEGFCEDFSREVRSGE